MKNSIFLYLILISLGFSPVFSQTKTKTKGSKTTPVSIQVPEKIKEAFKTKFPQVADVKWSKDKTGQYEGKFVLDGKKKSVNYDGEGNWLETETSLAITDLPAAVLTSFKKLAGADAKITETAKIELKSGETWFEIEYKKGKATDMLLFDENGNQH